MGSASLDILFNRINREAAQFIQERTLVAMRLFLKEMGGGLSVTKAAKKMGVVQISTVRRWVFGRLVGAHVLRVFVTSFGWLDRPEHSAGDDLERAYSSSVKACSKYLLAVNSEVGGTTKETGSATSLR